MQGHRENRPVPRQGPAFEAAAHSRGCDWEPILTSLGLSTDYCLTRGGTHLTYWRSGNGQDGFSLVTAGACSSSMDLAWQLVHDELLPPWASVLVTSQCFGRGRFRRRWHSPAGNVYGSLRVPRLDAAWRALMPLLLGAGVIDVLLGLNVAARIKWPNDILVGYKKVGGILIEERDDTHVAGVGLNMVSSPSGDLLRSGFALPAGCLRDFGVHLSPADLWVRLVRHLRSDITMTTAKLSPKEFVERLELHMAYVGQTIILRSSNEEDRPATLLGLDPDGGIRVRTSGGEQVFCSGTMYPASG